METIKKIIQAAGYDDVDELDVNELLQVENEPFMDLHIEKLGDTMVSVAHYYTQRGDLMSDPEFVFDTSGDEWVPVEYTQHGVGGAHEYDEDGLDAGVFVGDWDDQLNEQGFVQAALSQLGGDNNE